jgi:2-polyprenyl-6-methoxyphenol hydroxylase-like FAD-dependent oxidoreductase
MTKIGKCLHHEILIVGGGPVGLVLGILLQNSYKVPVHIIERQLHPTRHPQAHFINLRSMEIVRIHMPGLHNQLLASAANSNQVN